MKRDQLQANRSMAARTTQQVENQMVSHTFAWPDLFPADRYLQYDGDSLCDSNTRFLNVASHIVRARSKEHFYVLMRHIQWKHAPTEMETLVRGAELYGKDWFQSANSEMGIPVVKSWHLPSLTYPPPPAPASAHYLPPPPSAQSSPTRAGAR